MSPPLNIINLVRAAISMDYFIRNGGLNERLQ